MEVKKQKAEEKIERQVAVNKEETATEVYFTFPMSVMCDLFSPDRFFISLIFFFIFGVSSAGDNVQRAGRRPGRRGR